MKSRKTKFIPAPGYFKSPLEQLPRDDFVINVIIF